jgi:hypothetical protein
VTIAMAAPTAWNVEGLSDRYDDHVARRRFFRLVIENERLAPV